VTTLRFILIGLLVAALAVPATAAASYSVNGWQSLNSVPLYQYEVPGPLTGWNTEAPLHVIADPFLSGRCFPASLQQTWADAVNAEATGQALQLPPDYQSDDLSIDLSQYNLNTFAAQGPDTSTVRAVVGATPYQHSACLASEYRQVLYNDVADNYSVQTPTLVIHALPVGDQAFMTQAASLVPHLSTNPTAVISPGQSPGNQTTVPAAPATTYIYAEDDVVRVRDGMAELSVLSVNHPLPDNERLAMLREMATRLNDTLDPAQSTTPAQGTPTKPGTGTRPGTSTASSSSSDVPPGIVGIGVGVAAFLLAIAALLAFMFSWPLWGVGVIVFLTLLVCGVGAATLTGRL
jgi:hypothetical protein